jgi:hypothetical protein
MATQDGDTIEVYLHFRSGSETVATIATDLGEYDFVDSAHARTATHGIEPLPPDLIQISVDRTSEFSPEEIATVLYERYRDHSSDDATDLEAIHIGREVLSGEPDEELIETTVREALEHHEE